MTNFIYTIAYNTIEGIKNYDVRGWERIYEVYLDTLALQSFLLDLVVLSVLNRIRGSAKSQLRVLAFAGIETVLACVALVAIREFYAYFLIVSFVVHPLVLSLLFRERLSRRLLMDFVLSYALGFFLGGILQALYGDGRGLFDYEQAVALGTVFFVLVLLWCREKLKQKLLYCRVCLEHGTQKLELLALIDSGNLLREPGNGRAVSLVDRSQFERVFGTGADTHFVPYESLGCECGLLEVVRLDRLWIHETQNLEISNAFIGLVDPRLFQGKGYRMILNLQNLRQEADTK